MYNMGFFLKKAAPIEQFEKKKTFRQLDYLVLLRFVIYAYNNRKGSGIGGKRNGDFRAFGS